MLYRDPNDLAARAQPKTVTLKNTGACILTIGMGEFEIVTTPPVPPASESVTVITMEKAEKDFFNKCWHTPAVQVWVNAGVLTKVKDTEDDEQQAQQPPLDPSP